MRLRWILAAMLAGAAATGCTGHHAVVSQPEPQAGGKPSVDVVETEKKRTVGSFTQEPIAAVIPAIPEAYKRFFAAGGYGPVVPGVRQGLVPQGLAYDAVSSWLIISAYRDGGAPSVLSVVDAASHALIKTLTLYEKTGTPYKGHAGGIAVSANHLWLGGENGVRGIPLDTLRKAKDGDNAAFTISFRPETKATFMSYANGVLWVGEFYDESEKPNRITDRHRMRSKDDTIYNAWAAGYVLDPVTDVIPKAAPVDDKRTVPDLIMSIPDQIQGLAFYKDQFVLSRSLGRKNDSFLLQYRNVTKEPAHTAVTLGNREVPVWILDSANQTDERTMPPLSEGLAEVDGSLYILFESAAQKYSGTSKFVMDRLYYLR